MIIRIFGWALFKVQKVSFKFSKNDSADTAQEERHNIVSDISVNIKDVIHDEQYVRMYYSRDDKIRNEGKLTLINPLYFRYFAGILNKIKTVIKYTVENDCDDIPDKEIIKNI